MLIGIDSSPCSLSLRNRSTLCSTTKCHQNKSDLKDVFVQKSFYFSIYSILSIPIMLIGINDGYFPAICRVCFTFAVIMLWPHFTSLTLKMNFSLSMIFLVLCLEKLKVVKDSSIYLTILQVKTGLLLASKKPNFPVCRSYFSLLFRDYQSTMKSQLLSANPPANYTHFDRKNAVLLITNYNPRHRATDL